MLEDAIKFPDLIHSVKREPHDEIPQASSAHDTFWDFGAWNQANEKCDHLSNPHVCTSLGASCDTRSAKYATHQFA